MYKEQQLLESKLIQEKQLLEEKLTLAENEINRVKDDICKQRNEYTLLRQKVRDQDEQDLITQRQLQAQRQVIAHMKTKLAGR